VLGWWAVNGITQTPPAADRTNKRGVAVLDRDFADVTTGDVIRFCIDKIVKRGYTYDEPSNEQDCVEQTVF
jgi:hypothetical protein